VDANGNIIGQSNDDPILNLNVYDVEFPDAQVKGCAAGAIAQNMAFLRLVQTVIQECLCMASSPTRKMMKKAALLHERKVSG